MVKLLLIGAVIGANNFAAALALGALGQKHRRWRIVPVFGAVEFAVPLIGLLAGQRAARLVSAHTGWIAPTLLAATGAWVIWSALRSDVREEAWAARAATLKGTFALALGLAVDNLVVGFSLGMGGQSPLTLAATIAVFSIVFSWIGLGIGARLRRRWERLAEIAAGVLMLALAAATAGGAI